MKKIFLLTILCLPFIAQGQCKLFKDYIEPFEKIAIKQTKPVAVFNLHKKVTISWLSMDSKKYLQAKIWWNVKQETGTCFYDDTILYLLDRKGNVVTLNASWVDECDINSAYGMIHKSQIIRFELTDKQISDLKEFDYSGCKVKTEAGKDELIFAPISGPINKKKISKLFNQDIDCIGF